MAALTRSDPTRPAMAPLRRLLLALCLPAMLLPPAVPFPAPSTDWAACRDLSQRLSRLLGTMKESHRVLVSAGTGFGGAGRRGMLWERGAPGALREPGVLRELEILRELEMLWEPGVLRELEILRELEMLWEPGEPGMLSEPGEMGMLGEAEVLQELGVLGELGELGMLLEPGVWGTGGSGGTVILWLPGGSQGAMGSLLTPTVRAGSVWVERRTWRGSVPPTSAAVTPATPPRWTRTARYQRGGWGGV